MNFTIIKNHFCKNSFIKKTKQLPPLIITQKIKNRPFQSTLSRNHLQNTRSKKPRLQLKTSNIFTNRVQNRLS